MLAMTTTPDAPTAATATARPHDRFAPPTTADLFAEQQQRIFRNIDRLFAGLMVTQWVAGIAAALVISPRAWAGAASSVHPHVWAAIVLGAAFNLFPAALATLRPGAFSTRLVISTGQALTSA